MKVSEVLSNMNCQYTLRGDADYDASQSINDFDIYWAGTAPNDTDFHASATDLQTKELLLSYEESLHNHINFKAQEKGYSDAMSCVSYVNSTNPTWSAEAIQFNSWRDSCWEYAINIKEQVNAGSISPPNISDFLNNIPVLNW